MRFLRPCHDCEKDYRPHGPSSKYCDECRAKRRTGRKKSKEIIKAVSHKRYNATDLNTSTTKKS